MNQFAIMGTGNSNFRAITSGVARMTKTASVDWWLSGGIDSANVLAAYQPKGAADYDSSIINLANPGTNNAVNGTAYPVWDTSNGWTFNGTTQYLSSAIITNAQHTVICRYTNGSGGGYRSIFGSETAIFKRLRMYTGGLTKFYALNAYGAGGAINQYDGIGCISGDIFYGDGIIYSGMQATWVGGNKEMFIGCNNARGSPTEFWIGEIQALEIINTVISAEQYSALSTAMAAL